jgi:hypothetical protein
MDVKTQVMTSSSIKGEGIFIQFNEEKLSQWEQSQLLQDYQNRDIAVIAFSSDLRLYQASSTCNIRNNHSSISYQGASERRYLFFAKLLGLTHPTLREKNLFSLSRFER